MNRSYKRHSGRIRPLLHLRCQFANPNVDYEDLVSSRELPWAYCAVWKITLRTESPPPTLLLHTRIFPAHSILVKRGPAKDHSWISLTLSPSSVIRHPSQHMLPTTLTSGTKCWSTLQSYTFRWRYDKEQYDHGIMVIDECTKQCGSILEIPISSNKRCIPI